MFRLDYDCGYTGFEEFYDSMEECVKIAEQYAEEAAYDEYFTVYDVNGNIVFDITDVDNGIHLDKIKTWQEKN